MAMNTGNKLAGHMERTKLVVFVSAGRTKTAFTAKGNKFEIPTVRTGIHGTTVRRVATMDHPVDIFNDSRTWMELVNDMFTIKKDKGKPLPLMNEGLGELRVSKTLF